MKISNGVNKKIITILFLVVIISGVFSVLLLPSFAFADVSTPEPGWTGIVPCGRNTDDPRLPTKMNRRPARCAT